MKSIPAVLALSAAFAANAQSPIQDTPVQMKVYGASERTDADQRITNDVVAALAGDRRMTGKGIVQVKTDRGRVTLTGRVTTFLKADWAGEVASSVEGVREVDTQVNPLVGKNF